MAIIAMRRFLEIEDTIQLVIREVWIVKGAVCLLAVVPSVQVGLGDVVCDKVRKTMLVS